MMFFCCWQIEQFLSTDKIVSVDGVVVVLGGDGGKLEIVPRRRGLFIIC